MAFSVHFSNVAGTVTWHIDRLDHYFSRLNAPNGAHKNVQEHSQTRGFKEDARGRERSQGTRVGWFKHTPSQHRDNVTVVPAR